MLTLLFEYFLEIFGFMVSCMYIYFFKGLWRKIYKQLYNS